MGIFARRLEEHPSPAAARREPSLQLSGRPGGREVDLPALQARGVGLAGRLTDADGRRVRLADDLAATTVEADRRLRGLLRRIDAFAERTAIAHQAGHAEPIRQAQVTGRLAELDLLHAGIGTIIWATGYRRSYPWLHVPVLDDHRGHQAPQRDHRLTGPARGRDAVADPAVLLLPGRGSVRRRHGSSPRSLTTCVARL